MRQCHFQRSFLSAVHRQSHAVAVGGSEVAAARAKDDGVVRVHSSELHGRARSFNHDEDRRHLAVDVIKNKSKQEIKSRNFNDDEQQSLGVV